MKTVENCCPNAMAGVLLRNSETETQGECRVKMEAEIAAIPLQTKGCYKHRGGGETWSGFSLRTPRWNQRC